MSVTLDVQVSLSLLKMKGRQVMQKSEIMLINNNAADKHQKLGT